MECTSSLSAECVSAVFSAGFFLTVTFWAMGLTLGVAISAVKKL